MAETAPLSAGALASLKPRIGVPAAVQGPMLVAAPALMAVWALAGFYASLGPTLVRSLVGSNAIVLGGAALFLLAGSGALAVLAFQRHEASMLSKLGAMALVAGVSVVMLAIEWRSMPGFAIGTGIAGIGFGAGFQGALRSIVARIAAHERASVMSVLFVISYLALGVPAVAAGWGLAKQGDIITTALEFGAMVLGLSALALWGSVRKPA
jgi:hypothetical protein